jgi:hypothetical protein
MEKEKMNLTRPDRLKTRFSFLIALYCALLPLMEVPQTALLGKKIQYSDAVFLAAALLFAGLLLEKLVRPLKDRIFLPLGIYFCAAVASIWPDVSSRGILETAGIAYLTALFTMIYFSLAQDDSGRIQRFLSTGWGIGFGLVCAGILAGFTDGYLLHKERSLFLISYGADDRYKLMHRMVPRIVSTLRSPDMMTSYLIATAAFVPGWWQACRTRAHKSLLLAGCAIAVAGAVLSTSRGIIGLLAAISILTLAWKSTPWLKAIRVCTAVTALLLSLPMAAVTICEPSRIEITRTPQGRDTHMLAVDFHIANKVNYWNYAWRMSLDHPLRGVGAGNFNRSLGEYFSRDPGRDERFRAFSNYDPHQTYLGVLAETGIFGLAGFCAFLGLVFWRTIRAIRKGRDRAPLIGIAAAFAGLGILSLTMDAQNLRHLWILAAIASAYHYRHTRTLPQEDR